MLRLTGWLTVLGLAALALAAPSPAQEKTAPEKTATQTGKKPAHVRVLLPMDNATLTIEGQPTKLTGRSRLFVSPPLTPGKKYSYRLQAVWEPNNYTHIYRTKDITFEAGAEVEVDFNQENPDIKDDVKVRYVPTPQDIVEEMCRMGNISKDDIVYDLGCGDGRMVITAVDKFHAKKGIGIDLDPQRIKECKENAAKVESKDRLEFRIGNVLKVKDISDANVILLYMGDDLNNLLKPILLKSLKPGSRVVSHRFTMGDWKPTKSVTITGKDGDDYELHLWVIGEGEKKEEEKK
jgi:uncharacterized protein (TIGR03000 family)